MRPDICLIVPPFAQVETPTLGVAILSAACQARGLSVDIFHANIMLAAQVGHAAYRGIANSNFASLLGEHLFRPYAYAAGPADDYEPPFAKAAAFRSGHDQIASFIPAFLEATLARIIEQRPTIIGISSAFQQTMAASAIAVRVKATAPEIRIVLGGPNVASPMGEALSEVFPWIDHFFSGEADVAFADFCQQLLSDEGQALPRMIHCPPLTDLRQSPTPVFDDYFADLRAAQANGALPAALPTALPMETSRGCWWGAKNHCTFCGLNGATMAFREKPAATALAEFDGLEARWNVGRFALADNIMPRRYLSELLPTLAERPAPSEIFYEVKANLTVDELALMARAGIKTIQPGIESLSTPVLRLMRKGVSAHQNIALLRDCRSLGIGVVWNYLYGFPGELIEHYQPLTELVPALEHLQPPDDFSALIIDRFSPYFNTPDTFGIEDVRPIGAYRGLYPPEARLGDIAYHFRGTYSTGLTENPDVRLAAARAIATWRLQWIVATPPELCITADNGVLVLSDTRRIAVERQVVIPEAWDAILRYAERPRQRSDFDAASMDILNVLVTRGYVIEHEGRLLSVVTRDDGSATRAPPAPNVAEPARR